jgi:sugar lactone lactonase YvrE
VQSFSVSAQETNASGISFKDDGTKMYIVGTTSDNISEYDLSSAWDISTASYLQNYALTLFPTNSQGNVTGLYFKPDGTRIFCTNFSNDRNYSWSFSTPWDVSTGAQDIPTSNYFSPYSQDTGTTGVYISPDGLNMYVVGVTNDKVYQYSLASAWNISGATYVRDFSVSAQETAPTDVFFKSDGTKMYVLGDTGNDVNEYALSVAWDISTATYTTVFSVAGQDTSPQGMYFKSDGSTMYVVGLTNDKVYEYSLSTAWDISSASYVRDFSVSAQELTPTGISFKSDGTQMYVIGSASDNVNQYALSTPWDISTASYQKAFYVGRMMVAPAGLFFKNDGTEFYIIGSATDGYILSYDIV